MSEQPPVLAQRICPRCRAANYANAKECWLCQGSMVPGANDTNPFVAPGAMQVPSGPTYNSQGIVQSRVEMLFLWLFVAIVALTALVAVGLGAQDRGLLTLLLIVALPSLAAAGVQALYSLAKGETPRPSRMFITFAISALLTAMTGILLVVASVIFFLLTCAQMFSGAGPR